MIRSEEELEELLSRPTEADIQAMRALEGSLIVLGAGGKMGPTLLMRAARACQSAGIKKRIIAVARFTDPEVAKRLADRGVELVRADLLGDRALDQLPDAENVIFMAALKFGTTGAEHFAWAMNSYLPGLVAHRYRSSRIAVFSTGNVYPMVPPASGGATEDTPVAPVGEYAQSVLGRERLFQYASHQFGTPVIILRVNYANELRYGVLMDIGTRVFNREPIDLGAAMINTIWQGDANSMCIRSLAYSSNPPAMLNITGPEMLSVREVALAFGRHFGIEPIFANQESGAAFLSNSGRAMRLFGYPSVTPDQMIEWGAAWIGAGGKMHGKPTHFETRDGRF